MRQSDSFNKMKDFYRDNYNGVIFGSGDGHFLNSITNNSGNKILSDKKNYLNVTKHVLKHSYLPEYLKNLLGKRKRKELLIIIHSPRYLTKETQAIRQALIKSGVSNIISNSELDVKTNSSKDIPLPPSPTQNN